MRFVQLPGRKSEGQLDGRAPVLFTLIPCRSRDYFTSPTGDRAREKCTTRGDRRIASSLGEYLNVHPRTCAGAILIRRRRWKVHLLLTKNYRGDFLDQSAREGTNFHRFRRARDDAVAPPAIVHPRDPSSRLRIRRPRPRGTISMERREPRTDETVTILPGLFLPLLERRVYRRVLLLAGSSLAGFLNRSLNKSPRSLFPYLSRSFSPFLTIVLSFSLSRTEGFIDDSARRRCTDIRETVTLIHSPSVIIVNYDQVLSPAKHCEITAFR